MKDLHNNVKVSVALNTALTTATAQVAGSAIDRQGYESLEFVAQTGAVTATTKSISMKVQESATSTASDFTDVAASDLLGTVADFSFTVAAGSPIANKVRKIGYRGNKRYVRVVRAGAASTTGIVGASAVQGNPHIAPVA